MSQNKKNIWEIAVQLSESQSQNDRPDGNSTLVVVGSKRGGKTSAIFRFIDKNDVPKPTLALEYMFARKQNNNEKRKNVCNVWELGGGVMFTNLVEFAINEQNLESTSLVLVLDLSTPEELIITAETLTNTIRGHIDNLLNKSLDKNLKNCLKEKIIEKIGRQHEDRDKIKPFPIPILIMGTKYDIFQDLDPEKKKLIVRYLRILSHSLGAQLVFVSTKSEALMNRCRNALNHYAFGTPLDSIGFLFDYTKPIVIPFGSDSYHKIGYDSIDAVKRMYVPIFPQLVTELVIPDDPAKDINFKERDIDLIRTQKDSELEAYKRKLEVKQQSKFNRI